ncbi:MAG TPA: hypothetical protein VK550_13560 [Polyangiaceae bacterium]|nr:hypothetical protein [Polyangiaceae bacterium]
MAHLSDAATLRLGDRRQPDARDVATHLAIGETKAHVELDGRA